MMTRSRVSVSHGADDDVSVGEGGSRSVLSPTYSSTKILASDEQQPRDVANLESAPESVHFALR